MPSLVTQLLNDTHHKPDILDCIANLSNDEVFTPPKMAGKVLDALPKEVWTNPDLKWLDPAVKTGVFLREIAYRLMIGLKDVISDEEERRQHIFQNMLYGIGITELTALMSRRSLYTSKDASGKESIARFTNPNGNIDYENRPHVYVHQTCIYCGSNQADKKLGERNEDQERHAYKFIHLTDEEVKKMKFDVIVGNPPYQLKDGGHGASASPIYQFFVQQAKRLQPRYMAFIIPSRWFAGGKRLDDFRAEMLSDPRIKVVYDYPNSADCFPGVEIKGGVSYFIWDANHTGDAEIHTMVNDEELPVASRSLKAYDVFVRYNQAIPILEKVRSKHEKTLEARVSARKPFGFGTTFSDFDQTKNPDKVKIYARGKTGYISRERVQMHLELIDMHKVLISKGYNGGESTPHQIIGKPILTDKPSVCTETYVVAGAFNTELEAKNYEAYIKTRFFRFLVSLRKISQDATSKVYSFVPDLPMDQTWTDDKLFARYDITLEEQKFIQSMVKEMA